jgi:hypothetical protein
MYGCAGASTAGNRTPHPEQMVAASSLVTPEYSQMAGRPNRCGASAVLEDEPDLNSESFRDNLKRTEVKSDQPTRLGTSGHPSYRYLSIHLRAASGEPTSRRSSPLCCQAVRRRVLGVAFAAGADREGDALVGLVVAREWLLRRAGVAGCEPVALDAESFPVCPPGPPSFRWRAVRRASAIMRA